MPDYFPETLEWRKQIADIQRGGGDATRAALATAKAELPEARANSRRNQDAMAGTYEALAAIDKEIREAESRAEAGTKRRQADVRLQECLGREHSIRGQMSQV